MWAMWNLRGGPRAVSEPSGTAMAVGHVSAPEPPLCPFAHTREFVTGTGRLLRTAWVRSTIGPNGEYEANLPMDGTPEAMKWLPRLLAMGAVLLAAVGCERPHVSAIPGIYVAEYEGDQDTLQVLPDGTYTHAVGTGVSKPVDKGKWTVETL